MSRAVGRNPGCWPSTSRPSQPPYRAAWPATARPDPSGSRLAGPGGAVARVRYSSLLTTAATVARAGADWLLLGSWGRVLKSARSRSPTRVPVSIRSSSAGVSGRRGRAQPAASRGSCNPPAMPLRACLAAPVAGAAGGRHRPGRASSSTACARSQRRTRSPWSHSLSADLSTWRRSGRSATGWSSTRCCP